MRDGFGRREQELQTNPYVHIILWNGCNGEGYRQFRKIKAPVKTGAVTHDIGIPSSRQAQYTTIRAIYQ